MVTMMEKAASATKKKHAAMPIIAIPMGIEKNMTTMPAGTRPATRSCHTNAVCNLFTVKKAKKTLPSSSSVFILREERTCTVEKGVS